VVGVGGKGRRGGHEAASAKAPHGVREPHARPGMLGGARAQRLLGGSLTAGRQRCRRSRDGRGGSKSGDVVVWLHALTALDICVSDASQRKACGSTSVAVLPSEHFGNRVPRHDGIR
jgi:hypothetical protein